MTSTTTKDAARELAYREARDRAIEAANRENSGGWGIGLLAAIFLGYVIPIAVNAFLIHSGLAADLGLGIVTPEYITPGVVTVCPAEPPAPGTPMVCPEEPRVIEPILAWPLVLPILPIPLSPILIGIFCLLSLRRSR